MSNATSTLVIPKLGGIYAQLSTASQTLLRVVCGVALTIHGMPKIVNPFGNIEMVERLGFYPGVFWSPLLALTEFVGGILIALGLLTRPSALAALVVLLVTVLYHWIILGQGYSGAEKSILWSAITFYFVVHGANRHSIDARFGRQF